MIYSVLMDSPLKGYIEQLKVRITLSIAIPLLLSIIHPVKK